MSNIAMQIERLAAGSVAGSSNVIFDTIVYTDGNISYDTVTGVVTFNEAGRYPISWWVSTLSSASTVGAVFAVSTSQGDLLEGASPIKTGEVVGFAIVDVAVAPVTMSLINASSALFAYSPAVPVKATLTIVEDDVLNPELFTPNGAQAQLVDAAGGTVADGATVIFDTLVNAFGGVSYNPVTGAFTIGSPGMYYVTWWVGADGAAASTFVDFTVQVNGTNLAAASSPIVSVQLNGSAIFLGAPGDTVTLVNTTGDEAFLGNIPVQANMIVMRVTPTA